MPYCLHPVDHEEAAMPRIAFYTFGVLREPYDHPEIKSFMDLSGTIHQRFHEWDGFLWLHDGWEAIPRFADPDINTTAQTLSLWQDLACVHAFAYHGLHAEALR